MALSPPRLALIIALLAGFLILVFLFTPPVRRYLATQVFPIEEIQLNRKLKLTVDKETKPGDYDFVVAWEDPIGNKLLALSTQARITVTGQSQEENNASSSGTESSGVGGGGTATGQGAERTFVYQAEDSSKVTGSWSGVRQDGQRRVVKLAHQRARLSHQVAVPAGNYWLDINAKHDRPGPVDVVVYLNNRAWKVIRLGLNDNVYRTHRVGLLKNFSGATVQFRPLTDKYDRANPANEERDRNLHIDWWRLTTRADLTTERMQSGAVGRSGRSRGWNILPRLNQVVREELGQRFINFDLWRYYAQRLTAPADRRDAVQTEQHLRNIMRFWRGIRPDQPRGD